MAGTRLNCGCPLARATALQGSHTCLVPKSSAISCRLLDVLLKTSLLYLVASSKSLCRLFSLVLLVLVGQVNVTTLFSLDGHQWTKHAFVAVEPLGRADGAVWKVMRSCTPGDHLVLRCHVTCWEAADGGP